MLRTLLTLSILATGVFAQNYTVRLAAYHDEAKLNKALEGYPKALQQTIRTYKKGKFTYAYTLPTEDKATLKKLLPSYQKVFKDAYVIKTRLRKGQLQK